MALGWKNTTQIDNMGWTCGYCGKEVGGNIGYTREHGCGDEQIYICPRCENPTAFVVNELGSMVQVPAPVIGNEVDGLPSSVSALYSEVRRCIQYSAPTSAVMAMRKLLMHVAVEQGAKENGRFVYYVDYLEENGWIPPNGRAWVDSIRKMGNEATHEIALMGDGDARQLLDFAEMLLKIVYEFPAKLRR